MREAHERFQEFQNRIHGGEKPPSERVIDSHRAEFGREYRIETEARTRYASCASRRRCAVAEQSPRRDEPLEADVIDLLLEQHARIEDLFRAVLTATGDGKREAEQMLAGLVNLADATGMDASFDHEVNRFRLTVLTHARRRSAASSAACARRSARSECEPSPVWCAPRRHWRRPGRIRH
ncbi:hypothetical protein ACNTMW_32690 [Planosporangium sp. 12N6]|uniref:hypothetical protein n=1 Tax=Planosporangium spinosum TaxID=3402278 RepID=UPI003CEBD81A